MTATAVRPDVATRSAPGTRGVYTFGAGATVLATCFCSIDRIAFGAVGASMLGTRFGPNLYTATFGVAVLLIVAGLARRSTPALFPALLGAAFLGGGLVLAPPSAMHGVEPTLANLTGYASFLLGAAAMGWAGLRAFPTRNGGAACCAAGGFGAAAGCSCCVSSGAVARFAVAAGFTIPAAPFGDGVLYIAFSAVTVAGLWWLAGPKWALVALAGAVLALGGDEGLKPLLPDDVELLPRLLVTLVGTAVVVYATARAFGSMRPAEPAERPERRPAPAPAEPAAVGGVGAPV